MSRKPKKIDRPGAREGTCSRCMTRTNGTGLGLLFCKMVTQKGPGKSWVAMRCHYCAVGGLYPVAGLSFAPSHKSEQGAWWPARKVPELVELKGGGDEIGIRAFIERAVTRGREYAF